MKRNRDQVFARRLLQWVIPGSADGNRHTERDSAIARRNPSYEPRSYPTVLRHLANHWLSDRDVRRFHDGTPNFVSEPARQVTPRIPSVDDREYFATVASHATAPELGRLAKGNLHIAIATGSVEIDDVTEMFRRAFPIAGGGDFVEELQRARAGYVVASTRYRMLYEPHFDQRDWDPILGSFPSDDGRDVRAQQSAYATGFESLGLLFEVERAGIALGAQFTELDRRRRACVERSTTERESTAVAVAPPVYPQPTGPRAAHQLDTLA